MRLGKTRLLFLFILFVVCGSGFLYAELILPPQTSFSIFHVINVDSRFYFTFKDYDQQSPKDVSSVTYDSAGSYRLARFSINIFGTKNSFIEFTSISLTFTPLEHNDPNITAYYDYTLTASNISTGSQIGQAVFNSVSNYENKAIEFVENSYKKYTKTLEGSTVAQNFGIADLTIVLDDTYAAAGTYSANVICDFIVKE